MIKITLVQITIIKVLHYSKARHGWEDLMKYKHLALQTLTEVQNTTKLGHFSLPGTSLDAFIAPDAAVQYKHYLQK